MPSIVAGLLLLPGSFGVVHGKGGDWGVGSHSSEGLID
jgi:hypothetical protein